MNNNREILIIPIDGLDYYSDDWLYIVSTTRDDIQISGSNVLHLNYMDVNEDHPYAFNMSHAKEIMEFLKVHKGGKTIVCLCDAGQSRSPAIALALAEMYGLDTSYITNEEQYRPNMTVYNTLRRYIEESVKGQ